MKILEEYVDARIQKALIEQRYQLVGGMKEEEKKRYSACQYVSNAKRDKLETFFWQLQKPPIRI